MSFQIGFGTHAVPDLMTPYAEQGLADRWVVVDRGGFQVETDNVELDMHAAVDSLVYGGHVGFPSGSFEYDFVRKLVLLQNAMNEVGDIAEVHTHCLGL